MIESVRSRCGLSAARFALVLASFIAAPAFAQVVASDMTNSTSQNLTSFNNLAPAFSSAGDGFQKYQRGVSPTIPFSVLDDSDGSFPPDSLGIIFHRVDKSCLKCEVIHDFFLLVQFGQGTGMRFIEVTVT